MEIAHATRRWSTWTIARQPRLFADVPVLGVETLVVQWEGTGALTGGLTTDDILRAVPVDVLLLHGAPWQNEGPVLLSLRGGPKSGWGCASRRRWRAI